MSRTRRSNNDSSQSYTTTTITYVAGGAPTTTTNSGTNPVASCDAEVMQDVVTPTFRRLMRGGSILMNPMTHLKSTITSNVDFELFLQTDKRASALDPWEYYSHSITTASGLTGRYGFPFASLAEKWGTPAWSDGALAPFDYGSVASLESEMVARVLADSTDSDSSALVTMAELDKTFDMFVGGAKSAADLVGRLSRADRKDIELLIKLPQRLIREAVRNPMRFRKNFFRGAKDSFFKLASMWLGYRYGIMATYYDVESWSTVFSDRRSRHRTRYVASRSQKYDSGVSDPVVIGSSNFGTTYTTERFTRFTRVSAGLLTTMIESTDPSYSLGMRNVFSSAWELIPFSFVLDWFLDAGTRLKALDGAFQRPVLGSWVTSRSTLSRLNHRYEIPKGYVIVGNDRYSAPTLKFDCSVNEITEMVVRKANPSLSPLPSSNIRLNFNRVLDGISLIRPAIKMLDNILKIR